MPVPFGVGYVGYQAFLGQRKAVGLLVTIAGTELQCVKLNRVGPNCIRTRIGGGRKSYIGRVPRAGKMANPPDPAHLRFMGLLYVLQESVDSLIVIARFQSGPAELAL